MFDSHGSKIVNLFDENGSHAFINHLVAIYPGLKGVAARNFLNDIDEAIVAGHAACLTRSFDVEGVFLKSGNAHKTLVSVEAGESLLKAVVDYNLELRWEADDELANLLIYLPGEPVPETVEGIPSLAESVDAVCVLLDSMKATPSVVFLKQSLAAMAGTSELLSRMDDSGIFMVESSVDNSDEVYDLIYEGRTRSDTLRAIDEVIAGQTTGTSLVSNPLGLSVDESLIHLFVVRKLFESFAEKANELYLSFSGDDM